MGMNLGSPASADEPDVMLEINTTPLIDVMLVLLVMLIITIPIQLHAVNLQLAGGTPPAAAPKPEKIRIDIDAHGSLQWQGQPVTAAELEEKMQALTQLQPQPELHIRSDKNARYAVFVGVLASSKRLGLNNIAVLGAEQFGP